MVPGAQDQPTAGRNLNPSTDIGLCARPIKVMTGDDATVEDQLEVIDRHDGLQRYVVRQCRRLDQCNVIPGMFAIDLQTQQRAVSDEGPTLFQTRMQLFWGRLADNADE